MICNSCGIDDIHALQRDKVPIIAFLSIKKAPLYAVLLFFLFLPQNLYIFLKQLLCQQGFVD